MSAPNVSARDWDNLTPAEQDAERERGNESPFFECFKHEYLWAP